MMVKEWTKVKNPVKHGDLEYLFFPDKLTIVTNDKTFCSMQVFESQDDYDEYRTAIIDWVDSIDGQDNISCGVEPNINYEEIKGYGREYG